MNAMHLSLCDHIENISHLNNLPDRIHFFEKFLNCQHQGALQNFQDVLNTLNSSPYGLSKDTFNNW
jgi:hypothetical protein